MTEQIDNKLNERDKRIKVLEMELHTQREINQERKTGFEREIEAQKKLVKESTEALKKSQPPAILTPLVDFVRAVPLFAAMGCLLLRQVVAQ